MEEKINITGHCPIFKVPFNLFDFKEKDLQTINSAEELKDGMKVLVPNFGAFFLDKNRSCISLNLFLDEEGIQIGRRYRDL